MGLREILISLLNEGVSSELYDNALDILRSLRAAGFKRTYFVGGYVRDMLLGTAEAKDIDIATEARPDQVKEVFRGEKSIGVGESFNVVIIVRNGVKYEVATFRGEGKYSDGRRPDEVFFSDPESDAKRRDFTVNALFYDPTSDRVIDYVGGRKDLEKGLLRAIGEPEERFKEDYLRMMRVVRFFAQKGFDIEDETWESLIKNAVNINKKIKDKDGAEKYSVARERIREEMDKILMSDRPGAAIEKLEQSGLLRQLFPEISDLVGVEQSPVHHPEGDVFTHTMRALDMSDKDLELRWSILLHDIGKKQTHTIKDGKVSHPGHPQESVDMASTILSKYKLSSDEKKNILWLIRNHDVLMFWDRMSEFKRRMLAANPMFPKLMKHHMADRASTGDEDIISGETTRQKGYEAYLKGFMADSDKWEQAKKFTMMGGDYLMGKVEGSPFKFKQGEIIKRIKNDLQKQFVTGRLKNKSEMIDYVTAHYGSGEKKDKEAIKNLDVTGLDLKQAGVEKHEIRSALKKLSDKVKDGEVENKRESLLKYLDSTED